MTTSAVPEGGASAASPKTLTETEVTGGHINHNYQIAPTGEGIAAVDPRLERLKVVRHGGQERVFAGVRCLEYKWSPDGQRIAYLEIPREAGDLPEGADTPPAGVDLTLEGAPSPARTLRVLDLADGRNAILVESKGALRGIEWSPHGQRVYYIEEVPKPGESPWHYLMSVDTGSGATTELFRAFDNERITFFNPPVSVFEGGGGTTEAPYRLIYGTNRGLYYTTYDGKAHGEMRKGGMLLDRPTDTIENVEWSPSMDRAVIYFRYPPVIGASIHERGLFLVSFVGAAVKVEQFYELQEGEHLHTIWWSPRGGRFSAANRGEILLFTPEGTPITRRPFEGIKGYTWKRDESEILVAHGTRVARWLLGGREGEPDEVEVARLDPERYAFVADPNYLGDRYIYTSYEDLFQRREKGD